jgi:ADP-heptose:LPS heptosyltransferase
MKTAMICRYGAYGDLLVSSHIPRLVKKHYGIDHVTFETNYQGTQILNNNPFIDKLVTIGNERLLSWSYGILYKRWEYFKENYDYFFNLYHTMEYGCIAMEDEQSYYRDDEYRRDKYGKEYFSDHITKVCGLPDEYLGTRGEMFYPETEHAEARAWMAEVKKNRGVKFLILINLSGSSLHKKFIQAESIGRKILARYPDVCLLLTGDSCTKKQVFEGERIKSLVGKWNFRTAALMVKYVDIYIGTNTGLSHVSNMWNTPTVQLYTADSEITASMYAKNNYGIQSPVYCSPCYKGPYRYLGCPIKNEHPACIFFNEDQIMDTIEACYNGCLPRTS